MVPQGRVRVQPSLSPFASQSLAPAASAGSPMGPGSGPWGAHAGAESKGASRTKRPLMRGLPRGPPKSATNYISDCLSVNCPPANIRQLFELALTTHVDGDRARSLPACMHALPSIFPGPWVPGTQGNPIQVRSVTKVAHKARHT